MDLPPELRTALDRLLEGASPTTLAPIAEAQSDAYRRRADHGLDRLLIASELDALAYAAWRLPATFGAATAALGEVGRLAPAFAPTSHLDLGAGPGTALLAAGAVFGPSERRVALEGSDAFRRLGERLFDALASPRGAPPDWRGIDFARSPGLDAALPHGDDDAGDRFDLVTLCYLTGELTEAVRLEVVDEAWRRTRGVLVIVEPGTTAGYQRILAARGRLLEGGAHVVGPCPHAAPCPLTAPDWCHFAVRVPRSRTHRQVKGADLGYEDEKYAWLAVARVPTGSLGEAPTAPRAPASEVTRKSAGAGPAAEEAGRLLRPARVDKAAIELELCLPSGEARRVSIARRSKAAYKAAKKLRWGQAVPAALIDEAKPI